MKYSTFLSGLCIVEDKQSEIITGTCLHSYNNHAYNSNKIKNKLQKFKSLLNGDVFDDGKVLTHSDLWSAPWLAEGYKVTFHGVTYVYDVSISEIVMTSEKYIESENPLKEFYEYCSDSMKRNYRANSNDIVSPESGDIQSLMMDITQALHVKRLGNSVLSEQLCPIWIQLK